MWLQRFEELLSGPVTTIRFENNSTHYSITRVRLARGCGTPSAVYVRLSLRPRHGGRPAKLKHPKSSSSWTYRGNRPFA